MIFIDTNPFVIALRYPRDRNAAANRRFLERVREDGAGMTGLLNVLECCGVLSFNLTPRQLDELFAYFGRRFGVTVVPAAGLDTRLPAPQVRDVLPRMRKRMSLKDVEIALEVDARAPSVDAFVSWNAVHFAGRLAVPAVTPAQWLERG